MGKAIDLEVAGREAPALTAAVQDRVDAARHFYRRTEDAERHFMAHAFLCGAALLALKSSCDHGDFMAFREAHMPEISRAKAQRFMQFSEMLKTKLLTVSNLQIGLGQALEETVERQLMEELETVAEGRSMSKLLNDLRAEKDGAARKPGRQTAKQRAEAEKRQAQELASTWLGATRALQREVLTRLDDETLQELLDEGIELNNALRKLLKS